jgi:hypothetical protein
MQEIDFGLRGLPREFPDGLSAAAACQSCRQDLDLRRSTPTFGFARLIATWPFGYVATMLRVVL